MRCDWWGVSLACLSRVDFPFYFSLFASHLIASGPWVSALLVGAKAQASPGPMNQVTSQVSSCREVPGQLSHRRLGWLQTPQWPVTVTGYPSASGREKVLASWKVGPRPKKPRRTNQGCGAVNVFWRKPKNQVSVGRQVGAWEPSELAPFLLNLSDMSPPTLASSPGGSLNRVVGTFPAL